MLCQDIKWDIFSQNAKKEENPRKGGIDSVSQTVVRLHLSDPFLVGIWQMPRLTRFLHLLIWFYEDSSLRARYKQKKLSFDGHTGRGEP